MKRLLLALLLLANVAIAAPFFGTGAAVAATAPGTFSDPAQEARARNLQRQLRCLVCRGESIDESNADLAADMRRTVHEQIAAGRSDAQVLDFFHQRYGDFILMQPPVKPVTWLLWLAPFVVLVGAGGVAWLAISRARKAPESAELLDSENISYL